MRKFISKASTYQTTQVQKKANKTNASLTKHIV